MGEIMADVAEGDARDIDRVVFAARNAFVVVPEQNFRLGIRGGIVLCKVLNRIDRLPK